VRTTLLSLVAVGALLLAGCGDDDPPIPPGPEFNNARGVARALGQAGFGCDDFELIETTQSAGVEDPAAQQGRCTIRGTTATIAYFDDFESQVEYRRLGETVGCELAKKVGLGKFHFVDGNRWTVEPEGKNRKEERQLVALIANDFGGNPAVIDCDPGDSD
jgi:hypothetical protein